MFIYVSSSVAQSMQACSECYDFNTFYLFRSVLVAELLNHPSWIVAEHGNRQM